MITAWTALFRRSLHLASKGRAPTPQLTSLENPEKYLRSSPHKRFAPVSAFSVNTSTAASSANVDSSRSSHDGADAGAKMDVLDKRPMQRRGMVESGLKAQSGERMFHDVLDGTNSRVVSGWSLGSQSIPIGLVFEPEVTPQPSTRRLSQIRPDPSHKLISGRYTPMRDAPTPPPSRKSPAAPKSSP